MTILKLKPACKDYLWGGHRLVEEYGIEYDGDILAEAWELSCHPDGPSVITNGEYAGKTLKEFIDEKGMEVLGLHCRRFREFPILTKFIDARDNLSIQVHPGNSYALKNEGQYGKTEMWYVLDEEKIRYELTEDMEAGYVIDVTPKQGEQVEADSSVEIVVSSGIGVRAKDYTGKNINTVMDEIAKEYPNMKVDLQEVSSPLTSGTIIEQSTLNAGDLFDPGKVNTISFTYSAYPTVIIPEDIMGKAIADAVRELEDMGLKVYTSNRSLPKDIDEMTPDEQEAISFGTVIDCSPASGTSYTQSTDNYITLYYY